ncbi:substrate-binding periplasmic protein [Spartinivicinus poritis]|uniref:Transporter substrate-binding domain-containing protein n=1 Tax=Spartinivicinus poritis TaxID=2994640 RepID=A0ABT5U6N0_9GAMM|nr:transporter substrate-binding domain-containing protein [Spartinivicinus sp. A2-2]MDE1462020.1 transporter substrate-binding domain-containing protein [Spartinivicinus sp. A2-2]
MLYHKITVLLLFSLFSCPLIAKCKHPLTFGWDSYKPFQYMNNGKLSGIDIEIIDAIAKEMKCQVTYIEIPWKRLVEDIKKGTIMLTGSATLTKEREAFAYFTRPYLISDTVIFINKSSQGIYKLKTLKDILNYPKFTIGVIRGYEYGEEYKKLTHNTEFNKRIIGLGDEIQNFKMLASKRITATLVDELVGATKLRELNLLDSIVIYPLSVNANFGQNHFMISKKAVSTHTFEQFSNSLKEIENKGILKKIIDQYRLQFHSK